MRGLGSLRVGVLVFACIYACCEAGPLAPFSFINPFSRWARQSGNFAASILNVQWLYNTQTQGKLLQSVKSGRYQFYRVWFRAYNFDTQKKVTCKAQVHWPPLSWTPPIVPPQWNTHLDTPGDFPSCW